MNSKYLFIYFYLIRYLQSIKRIVKKKSRLKGKGRNLIKRKACNWTRTHNHLVCKQTFSHLPKLAFYAYFKGKYFTPSSKISQRE